MNFREAYEYLLSFNNLPRLEYMTDKKSKDTYLKRLQFFLDTIGNPEKKIKHYIHITGTSGKGSVTSFLHSILFCAGKNVGSVYSPHPTYITERWKINNRYMSKKEFVLLVEKIKPHLDKYMAKTPYDMLSFFEITEVLGLMFFAQNNIDWAVVEVSCGGRYDATNVIPYKDAAIITNIGLDHVGIIGNNKKEIAYEKAGIIKKCPTFTMEKNKEIKKIFEREAKKQNSKIYDLSGAKFKITKSEFNKTNFVYKSNNFTLPLIGQHQIKNAILCIELMRHLKISNKAITNGLKTVKQPLRLEVVKKEPLIILDGAHNSDKIKTTVESIKKLNLKNNLYVIVGFSHDKNVKNLIKKISKLKPHTIFCTRNTINHLRKVSSPQMIQNLFKKEFPKNKNIFIRLDPKDAWKEAVSKASPNDTILVTGSIFLSGEIRGII